MKDALGGTMLLYIVVIFISVIILLFVGILSYSKAYKVKNKIIEIIERNDGQITDNSTGLIKADILDEISTELSRVGYAVSTYAIDCNKSSSRGTCSNLNTTSFRYCLCEQSAVNQGKSFEIITYVHFDFPIIGDLINIPVKGETRILGKDYNY